MTPRALARVSPRAGRAVPIVGLALLAFVALAIPAASAQQTTAPATTAPANGITPTSVKVGGLGWALEYGGADVGARARFARANASGGVNGRTIDYVGFRDDGGDPAASAKAATAYP